ncbi:MAG TPA: PAS domain-containing sensor histidine kinase [Vicinamibacterales bacterium]|nr:PAS domain-containing sensor histidine kinase [Vicinamibacterales bacterium]
MSRIAAPLASVHGIESDVKLAFVEFLLTSIDIQESSRRAVDWLVAHAPVTEAAVLVAEGMSNEMLLVAEHGISSGAIMDFSLSREDSSHPLIQALNSHEPVFITGVASHYRVPLEADSFHVISLRADAAEPAHGLLLVAGVGPQIDGETMWLGRTLGKQVSRLLGRQLLAETRFGQERMLLYSIINAVTDPILLTDTEGKLIIANTHAEKLFAAPEEASEGWRRAAALNNMLFSAALSTSAVGMTELARRELLLVDPLEGSDLLFELLSSRAKDERQGTYVVSILRNVTDLARAKEEIEESYRTLRIAQAEVRDERHRLDLIIDSVADPILVTDQEGDIVLMNTPAERLFNAPGVDDEGTLRRVRANGANLTSFVSNVLTRSGEQRYRGEIQLGDPLTGRPLPVEAVAGTILSEQGELMWVVTILHDLTEAIEKARLYEQLKQASVELERKVQEATAELAEQNELLRRQHIELEQASALKSQFLANMSHEFRTPLNAILGYTHMLLNNVTGQVTDPQRKSLTRIDSNSRHLLALISDILDITRIEAGRMPLNATSFGIGELFDEVQAELEPIIKRSNLAVSTKVRGPVPTLRSDRQKVKQIVLNLLSNALKFTPAGSVTMTASYDATARQVVIAVKDTGVGIPQDDQNKVFEDFRQLDSSPARGYGGTGLGLSICRRLANILGGTIELESLPGKGSIFTLRLPAKGPRR